MFNGGGRGGRDSQKAKHFGTALKRIIHELKAFRILVIISILCAIGGSILSIIAPNQLSKITDLISEGIAPGAAMNFAAINGIALLMVGLYVSSATLELIEGLVMSQISNRFAKNLRTKISEKINRLPLRYFDRHQTGDILSRVTNDVDTVTQSLDNSLSSAVAALALLFGTIIMMFATNWILAITAMASTLIGFVFMVIILNKSQKYFIQRQAALGKLNAHIEEVYSGLNVVKAYNGKATRNTYMGHAHTFETYGNYDVTISKIHKLSVMAGYSWEEKESGDGFGLWVHDFYDDYLKWNQLSYASSIDGIPAVESGTKATVRNISFYGRAAYSYNSRYMLQATIRRDGSSVFGKDHRWGTFPSVSAAWNITEEPFMKNQNVFSNLKLRMGYGVSGNALGFNAYTAIATYGASGFFDYNGKNWRTLAATKNANPDLKWESTGMFNIGIDYALFGGRINGTLEFYNKKTKDLIWSYPVSLTEYPFGNIDANVGEITNKGIELTVNATPVKTKDFTWQTTLNLAHNKNRVDKLTNDKYFTKEFNQGDPMIAGVSANGYTQRIIEGEPLGTFYTFTFAGYNDKGVATYYVLDDKGNRTGETTTAPDNERDRSVTGCAQPKLNLGWNNTLTYKNWSASCFFTGVFGNKIYNGSRAQYTSPEMFSNGKNVLKEFVTDRPATDISGNIPSDRFIENGSYLRLQSLTLGYTFTKFNGWLQNAQLYATVNNVFTITSYKGLDPEVNLGGIDPGVDYRWSNYPHTRTFMLGLKVNF